MGLNLHVKLLVHGTTYTHRGLYKEQGIDNDIWKGALHWVEEVGYTTDDNGISTAINYVDSGASYTPYPNRSYYG